MNEVVEKIITALNKRDNCENYEAAKNEKDNYTFIRKGNGHNENQNFYFINECVPRDLMREALVKIYNQTFKTGSLNRYLNYILIDTPENRKMIDFMFFDTKGIPQFLYFDSEDQYPLKQ